MDNSTVKKDFRKNKEVGVYMTNLITRKIHVPFNKIGSNIASNIEMIIKKDIEGKCAIEGYIKPNSVKIVTFSSGLLVEDQVLFEVVFECMVCCPVEGMLIKCIVKNVTQAGIRAVINVDASPVVIYISRDHHYNNKYFTTVKENDEITIRVIGQRYELNDEQVSVMGELVEPKTEKQYKSNILNKKPKLVIQEKI